MVGNAGYPLVSLDTSFSPPLLVGVMHNVTGDQPAHAVECQTFKMDWFYVEMLQEVFSAGLELD